jgi:hypothetical protein
MADSAAPPPVVVLPPKGGAAEQTQARSFFGAHPELPIEWFAKRIN